MARLKHGDTRTDPPYRIPRRGNDPYWWKRMSPGHYALWCIALKEETFARGRPPKKAYTSTFTGNEIVTTPKGWMIVKHEYIEPQRYPTLWEAQQAVRKTPLLEDLAVLATMPGVRKRK